MTPDWYPAIRECCTHWSGAAMLQQTFEALERSFADDNDACIDCAKCIVEVVCRVIIDELDDPAVSVKPKEEHPSFATWVGTAVRVLKLGEVRDDAFRKLISQHHKLTETVGALRNGAGPVSHGKDGFINRLSAYHRRAAVLSADAIVAFLHQAYLEVEPNLARTREPYERFAYPNALIDRWCSVTGSEIVDDGGLEITLSLPGEEPASLVLDTTASQLLFYVDRAGYIEALNAAVSAEVQSAPADEAA